MPTKIEERFWSYVEKTDDCWIWKAGKFSNGYGQFRVGKKKVKAHRFAYELAYGEILPGLNICHKCDNPSCVRPDHLFLGDHKINAIDRRAKGRGASGMNHGMHTCPHKRSPGEKNGSAKLTWEEVRELREARDRGWSYNMLARAFHLSKSQVANIVKERSWVEAR